MRSREANGEIFLASLAEPAVRTCCDVVESLCLNIGQTRWISRMRVSFVYFLASGIIQNLFTFSLDIGPKQVLINLILLLLSMYGVYKLNCIAGSGKHIGIRRVTQLHVCCCGGVHVQCMSHARLYLLDLLQILRKSIGLHSHVCVSVLFLSMHFSCYLLCFVHSRKAAAVWLFNNSRRQSPYKGKQSRSTPQQNKEATSKWKTTFYTNAGLNESPKGKNFRTILIICFIMFRHQFELVRFARKELTAWAIPLPIHVSSQ